MNVSSKTVPLHNCSTTSTSSASSSLSAEHSSSASSSSADRSPSRDNVTNGKETVQSKHLNDSVNSYDAGSPIAEFNEFKPSGDLTKQLAGTLDLNKVIRIKNHLFCLINQIIICFYFYPYVYVYLFFKST
jgi:hypothetical protein